MEVPTRRFVFALLAGGLLAGPAPAHGQQVKTAFQMHLDTLPIQQQEDLRDFNQALTDYVEGYIWYEEDLPQPVQVNIEAFMSYRGSRTKTEYSAKTTISNGVDIRYLDRFWRFEFEKDDILRHDNQNFNSLTWFIDYYVHIMIGNELDKYSEFGGEDHFKQAETICRAGRFDPYFQWGWDERLTRIEEILSEDYRPFRAVRAIFYSALKMEEEENNKEAVKLGRQVVDMLAAQYKRNARDERIKAFFIANYLTLAEVFKTESSADIYKKLKEIDPGHRDTYDEYIANIGG